MAISEVSCSFYCGLRGYHQYRLVWNPTRDEELVVKHESQTITIGTRLLV